MDSPAPGSFFVRQLLRALMSCALVASVAEGQSATVRGAVTDSAGRPVPGVEIAVSGTELRARSDDFGAYRLSSLAPGLVTVSARRLGFKAFARTFQLAAGAEQRVDIRLMATPEVLDAVDVVAPRQVYDARLEGFNARSARKVGHFVTRERIDRANSTNVTDLLRELPGVKIGHMRNQGRAIRLSGKDCQPLIFVDGFPATAGEFDIDMIDLQSIEGIEVYGGLGTIPPEFSGPRDLDRCGVIAVWSRPSRSRRAAPESRRQTASAAEAEALTPDQVDVVARIDSGARAPTYPDSLLRLGLAGRVVMEFIVDATGQVEPASIEVMASSHPLFTQAVSEALVEARFRPAVRAGRAVRQVVQMPFSFAPPTAKRAVP